MKNDFISESHLIFFGVETPRDHFESSEKQEKVFPRSVIDCEEDSLGWTLSLKVTKETAQRLSKAHERRFYLEDNDENNQQRLNVKNRGNDEVYGSVIFELDDHAGRWENDLNRILDNLDDIKIP